MTFPSDKELHERINNQLRTGRELRRRDKIRELAMDFLMNGEFGHMARELALKRAINRATLVYDDVMACPIPLKEPTDG